jgi:hypothetical protein
MAVLFHNQTGATVWVMFARNHPPCGGPPEQWWLKKGWYQVPPGSTVNVWDVRAGGQKIFYFAEDQAGNTWGNDTQEPNFFTQVPWQPFEWCWNTGSTSSRVLGLRKRVMGNVDNHTFNLQ